MARPLILLTNDDGVHSKGLWALAAALDELGELLIVAPEEGQSGSGRSLPLSSKGRIAHIEVKFDGRVWAAYAVHGSPAQAVQHALLELATRPVALVVSGINYGENIGLEVTISGTVGAALEAANFGVPGIAVSQQVPFEQITSHDPSVDFSAAAHFALKMAVKLLAHDLPDDVHVLKIDVPQGATNETPWQLTRLTRRRYYTPLKPEREGLEDDLRIGVKMGNGKEHEDGSDARAVGEGLVSVTPLSLDLTSRVDWNEMRTLLDGTLE